MLCVSFVFIFWVEQIQMLLAWFVILVVFSLWLERQANEKKKSHFHMMWKICRLVPESFYCICIVYHRKILEQIKFIEFITPIYAAFGKDFWSAFWCSTLKSYIHINWYFSLNYDLCIMHSSESLIIRRLRITREKWYAMLGYLVSTFCRM